MTPYTLGEPASPANLQVLEVQNESVKTICLRVEEMGREAIEVVAELQNIV